MGEYHGALGDHTGEAEIGDCLPGFLLPVPGVPCQQQALLAVLNDVVEYGPGTMIAQQRQDIQFTCCEWLEGLELVPGCVERVEFESSDLLPHRIAAIDIEMWQRRLIAENRSPPTHKKTVKVIGVGMTDEQMLQPVEDHAVTDEMIPDIGGEIDGVAGLSRRIARVEMNRTPCAHVAPPDLSGNFAYPTSTERTRHGLARR